MKIPILNKRLATIAELVDRCGSCADIGTDHAYLITWLAVTGKIERGFAADIHAMPLERAAKTIEDFGMNEKIVTVLSDGLSSLPYKEIDKVVIAGMGGDLIAKILAGVCWDGLIGKQLVLQPMTKAERLREYLCKNGFETIEERAVMDGRFVYTVLSVVFTGVVTHFERYYYYTGKLLNQTTTEEICYIERVERLLENKVRGLSQAEGMPYRTVLESIRERRVCNDKG